MASPLEDYLADLISQHTLKESMDRADQENDLAQSQADEQLALNDIDSIPFNMAARSYNMNPKEWIGKETEARAQMKRKVSSSYLSQRAKAVNEIAGAKKESTQNLLSTLTRLHSVNQRGITSIEEFAPRDAGLRSQLVIEPSVGGLGSPVIKQVAKNIPDEAAVRNREIADYLQVPEHVVQQQRTLEQQSQNDADWKQLRRQVMLDKDLKAIAAGEKADERADAQAKWTARMQAADAALKFSKQSKAFVDQIIADPETPPEMKESASIANALRPAIAAARQEKDRTKWKKLIGTIASKALQTDTEYQASVAAGTTDRAKLNLALQGAMQILEEEGVQQFSLEQQEEDFGFPAQAGSTLSEIENLSRTRTINERAQDELTLEKLQQQLQKRKKK